MSTIAEELTRIQAAKADIKTAIEEKGVTVGTDKIDTYADKIRMITGGGESQELYWEGTQAEYDALTDKTKYKIYGITE